VGARERKTENALLRLPFKAAYMFRPGYIQPPARHRSKTWWYQAAYDVIGWLYPALRRLVPRFVTTTVNIGLATIEVAANGYEKPILLTPDIQSRRGPLAARQHVHAAAGCLDDWPRASGQQVNHEQHDRDHEQHVGDLCGNCCHSCDASRPATRQRPGIPARS